MINVRFTKILNLRSDSRLVSDDRCLHLAAYYYDASRLKGQYPDFTIKGLLRLLLGRSEVDRELGRTWALAEDVRGSAVFSDCGNYRPYLSRRWAQGDMIMWLCMNPSSATDVVDDSTSRKLTRHSRRFGFGGLFLLNIMDYRETDPDRLPEGIEQSRINQRFIMKCARLSAAHILAYGGLQKKDSLARICSSSR